MGFVYMCLVAAISFIISAVVNFYAFIGGLLSVYGLGLLVVKGFKKEK